MNFLVPWIVTLTLFHSEKQYKRRLSKWSLDKNVKIEEMRAIILAHDHRKQQGKESDFYVRRRRVYHHKLARCRRLLADERRPHGYNQIVVDNIFRQILAGDKCSRDIRCFTPASDDPNLEKRSVTLEDDPETHKLGFTSASDSLSREEAFSRERDGWICPNPSCTEEAFDRFGDLEVHFADHNRSPESRAKDSHPAPSMMKQITGWEPSNGSSGLLQEVQQPWNPFDKETQWAQWITDVSTWRPQYPVNDCSLPLDPLLCQADNDTVSSPLITMEDLMAEAAELFKDCPNTNLVNSETLEEPSASAVESSSCNDHPPTANAESPEHPIVQNDECKLKTTPRPRLQYVCERTNPSSGEICKAIFSRGYDRKRHNRTVHGDDNQKIPCMICGGNKHFKRRDGLLKHTRLSHPDIDQL